MKRSLLPLFLVLALVAHAASLERDLGHGLAYYRVQALPADLPTSEAARKRACVLDLRYAHGDSAAAAALQAWLKFHATARTPVFVLANAETATAVLASIAGQRPPSGVMTIGIAGDGFRPDLAVKNSAENERRSYDALASSTAVTALLTDHPDKIRNDEASLSKDRLAEAATDSAADVLTKNRAPLPPVDAALQRAVHMHRTLVALHKIPAPGEPVKGQSAAPARK